jgi:outer membrane receptor for ferrienterochelin and colicins
MPETDDPRDATGRKSRSMNVTAVWLALGLVAFTALVQTDEAQADEDDDDLDSVVVTATRSGQLVRDQPLRVEVVPDEEIQESLTVAPGNLTNILNELAGVRMQATAPGLGGTGLQFRGLPGRHAQVLSDGLPLGGTQADSFGLMQTPPLDLSRVEVIKGVASALYGGSALSGVLNLTSREPGSGSEVLLNQTSLGGSDLVGFLAQPNAGKLGYTLTGGAHYQSRKDPDHDGWAEVPGYTRVSLRPRLFWEPDEDRTIFGTLGVMGEDREGGTLPGRVSPTSFPEALHTRRADAGVIARFKRDDRAINLRWSANVTEHDRVFGSYRIFDRASSVFGEATLSGAAGIHNWVLGAVLQYERLQVRDVPGVSYAYTVPGLFAQDELAATPWLSFAASARVDEHSDYGTFFSPRVSALIRVGSEWSLRASAGTGFSAPTPLIEDVQARSLGLVNPLRGLRAERAQSASLDLKWAEKPLDVNLSVFASQVRHPLDVAPAAGDRFDLVNNSGPLRVHGAEMLIGYSTGSLHVLANASYLDVTEMGRDGTRQPAELIPRFSAELATILEDEGLGRIGVEIAYTGRQPLEDNPYREASRPYLEINALAQLDIGRVGLFVNAMNLTGEKQQDSSPLLRPVPGPGSDPITDVWAPLTGRTYNFGIRLKF